MKAILALFLAAILTEAGFSQVIESEKVAEAKFKSPSIMYKNSYIKSEALPLAFLPDDIAIDSKQNIYIAESATLRIIKIKGNGQLINQIIISDESLVKSPQEKAILSGSVKFPFNLRLACDSQNNLYVLLLWAESFVNIFRYTEDLQYDKNFILEQPFPGHFFRDFLISPEDNLLISTFPVAPIGYEQYVKDGLVFEYSTDGKFTGRRSFENSLFYSILISKRTLLKTTVIDGVLINEMYPFLKINPKGEKFIWGMKSYTSEKIDRNKKIDFKDLGLEVRMLKRF